MVNSDLPLEGRNCRALHKHVLSTFVFKLGWLRHLQREDVSRIDSNLNNFELKGTRKKVIMRTIQQGRVN